MSYISINVIAEIELPFPQTDPPIPETQYLSEVDAKRRDIQAGKALQNWKGESVWNEGRLVKITPVVLPHHVNAVMRQQHNPDFIGTYDVVWKTFEAEISKVRLCRTVLIEWSMRLAPCPSDNERVTRDQEGNSRWVIVAVLRGSMAVKADPSTHRGFVVLENFNETLVIPAVPQPKPKPNCHVLQNLLIPLLVLVGLCAAMLGGGFK